MCDSRDKDIPLMKPIYFSKEVVTNPVKSSAQILDDKYQEKYKTAK